MFEITLNEKDAFRKILVEQENAATIPVVQYPGREEELTSNAAYIDFSRTNILGGELLGNQNSYNRHRNTFFITLEVNIPASWAETEGKDPEYEAEIIIAKLYTIFQPRKHLTITNAAGYISHGITIFEVETEDEKALGSQAVLRTDEAQEIYFRMYLRLTCEHIYLLPRGD